MQRQSGKHARAEAFGSVPAQESPPISTPPMDEIGVPTISHRRHDLDWLRVIAFGLLIYFHAAVVFIPSGIPMIHNGESSQPLQLFVGVLHQFRLALLFLISGIGVRFALRHRDRSSFIRDRNKRLLIPLCFGILVLVPPMVFLEKCFVLEFSGTFFEFYPTIFTTGTYPAGNLSWHHFWFLAYLYLFCLAGWPVFAYLKSARGKAWLARLSGRLTQGYRLYSFIVVLFILEVPLRAVFPGFRDLIHDWASFMHWFAVFLAGFTMASFTPLLERTRILRWKSLALAIATTVLLFVQFWSFDGSGLTPAKGGVLSISAYLWFCLLRMASVWFWLLVCLGLGAQFLNAPGRVLTYLNQAVYPMFCLHLPFIVAAAYLVVPLPLSIAAKYAFITTATVALSLGTYELAIRRSRWLRPLFGLTNVKPA